MNWDDFGCLTHTKNASIEGKKTNYKQMNFSSNYLTNINSISMFGFYWVLNSFAVGCCRYVLQKYIICFMYGCGVFSCIDINLNLLPFWFSFFFTNCKLSNRQTKTKYMHKISFICCLTLAHSSYHQSKNNTILLNILYNWIK